MICGSGDLAAFSDFICGSGGWGTALICGSGGWIADCRINARTLDLTLFAAQAVGVADCVLRVAGGFTA